MIKARESLKNIAPYEIDKNYPVWKIKIDSNENPYGTPVFIKDAIQNFDWAKISSYPAYGELLDKLADIFDTRSDNFVLTNGCDEAINVVFRTYLEPQDEVLSFAPTFSMPELYAETIGAKFIKIPYETMWNFNYEIFISKINEKTKILYLTTPNNPTGSEIPLGTIKKLLENFPNLLLVLDCTYFNYSDFDFIEFASLTKQYGNLIVLKSFSKDYALAGLRLGYIYADAALISDIKKVQSPYPVNAVAVCAGVCALNNREYFLEIKQKIQKSKEILVEGLKALGFEPYSSGGNFILCNFGDSAQFLYNKLLNFGIKVKFYKDAGCLTNCFRITIPRLEDVSTLLEVLKPRPLYVFDMDGVLFDVSGSYREAIKQTYQHFAGKTCNENDIQKVKNQGGMSNDWKVTHYMLAQSGVGVQYEEVVNVFQDLFFVPSRSGSKGLIDREELVFGADFFEELLKYADCAIFTSRPRAEAFYSLEKSGIKKYFSYFICNEDVDGNLKPNPLGLNLIKKSCLYTEIRFFGDTVDDIKAGVDASVLPYGIIPPNAKEIDATKAELKKWGAKDVFETPKTLLETLIEKDVVCK